MLSSSLGQNDAGTLIHRYAEIMGTLARQRRSEQVVQINQDHAHDIAKQLNSVLKQAEIESNYLENMSHQLRTMLNAILGFSELMENESLGPLPETYKQYATGIHSSGKELLGVLQDFNDATSDDKKAVESATSAEEDKASDVLAASAGSSDSDTDTDTDPDTDTDGPTAEASGGKVMEDAAEAAEEQAVPDIHLEAHDGVALLQAAFAEVREIAATQSVKIKAKVNPDLPEVMACATSITQVLGALLLAAIQGTAENSAIEIIVSSDDEGFVHMAVESSTDYPDRIANILTPPRRQQIDSLMHRQGGYFDEQKISPRHRMAILSIPAVPQSAQSAQSEDSQTDLTDEG